MSRHSRVRHICHACIGDQFLSNETKKRQPPNPCTYCGTSRPSISLVDLAIRIHEIIEEHFRVTPSFPDSFDEYLSYNNGSWERRGDPVDHIIAELAGLDQCPTSDLISLLSDEHSSRAIRDGEDDPYGPEALYEERKPSDWGFRLTWAEFVREIRSRSRFFSGSAEEMLHDIFGDLTTHYADKNRPVVREISPGNQGSFFWRARIAASLEVVRAILKDPVQELGPPPSELARAGRMNAHGISVFYGAFDEYTCISELRPPAGIYMVMGQFELLRPVKLLDLDALTELYIGTSHFDSDFLMHKGRIAFFKRLVWEISQPILPEAEALEYIAMQVVAEYLAHRASPQLDGIIYPSSQTGADEKNVVLFTHASRVEPYVLPDGSIVEISPTDEILSDPEYDGYDRILVSETVPPMREDEATENPQHVPLRIRTALFQQHLMQTPEDTREFALRLDLQSMQVARILGASHSTGILPVVRDRKTGDRGESLEQF